jgi:hypothetical protein
MMPSKKKATAKAAIRLRELVATGDPKGNRAAEPAGESLELGSVLKTG